ERLHNRLAVLRLLTGSVQRCRSGVDQMQNAAFRMSGQLMARYPLYRFRTPVRAHIGEDLCRIRKQIAEQHHNAVEHVILSRYQIRGANPVPVEGGIQYRLQEVAVREVVGPLTLSLEAGHDRIVTERFLAEVELGKPRIAD